MEHVKDEKRRKTMSRVNFGAKPLMLPQPVLIIGTYDENGVPNAMNAALIAELPMALECKVKSFNDGILIGEIVNVSADESVITDGKVDPKKLKPITFDPCNNTYVGLGDIVGNAFKDGLALK